MNILLVEPAFPVPDKSRNHSHFLPIGLLKIGTYHKTLGDNVHLVRGGGTAPFKPDRVLITSLFTYWSQAVHEAAAFYHQRFPRAQIEIGGIYASLMAEDCRRRSPFARVQPGLYRYGAAENLPVDYTLLPDQLDYQIIHASRGCNRRCAFCGTWRIEPAFTGKKSVLHEIQKPRVVFYDNNLLANPHIEAILREVSGFRFPKGQRVSWECQSGLDLRLLTPEKAVMLKESRMQFPRIAWDGPYSDWPRVRAAVDMLKAVGYGRKDIFVFMIYNHALPYAEMMKKVDACRRWRVRIIDCRNRPLNSTTDGYVAGPKLQSPGDYYIHPCWTDRQVRRFRHNVRQQNIAVLLDLSDGRYVAGCETRKV
jgi:hypothetical protein